MPLKSGEKIKLAAAVALLALTTGVGFFIFWEWSATPSQTASATTEPSASEAPTAPTQSGPPYSEMHKFQLLLNSDDTQHAGEMLAKYPSLVSVRLTTDHAMPLHLVKSVAMAKLLLDAGADVNAKDGHYSATPLRWAVSNVWNHDPSVMNIVKYLESRGATPDPDIYFAVAVGDLAKTQSLLAADPTLINKKSDNNDALFGGATPIQIAAYADQLETVNFLLDHGANVHDRSEWKNTEAIEKASWTGGADVVQLLVDRGANVNGTDSDYRDCPLYAASTSGHAAVVKILLTHGAKLSPILAPAVRNSMGHAHPGDPNTGTPEEFKEILAMIAAVPPNGPH